VTPIETGVKRGKNPRMFGNAMPCYEILGEDALVMLDGGWRRLVSTSHHCSTTPCAKS
jgi:hypothetical protein